ncbi:MAG: carbonic anhydrase [Bellilinea sp.]
MNELLKRLMEGNDRFSQGRALRADIGVTRRAQISERQQPFAMILGCSDSRVPPEVVFDCGLGDLFVIRTAGHTMDDAAIESMLFGIKALGIPLVLVLGHSHCGAVSVAIQNRRVLGNDESAPFITKQIAPAIDHCPSEEDLLNNVVKAHVKMTVARIEHLLLPVSQEVKVVGAYYDLKTGIVEVTQP